MGAADDALLVAEILTAEGILLGALFIETVLYWTVHRIRTRLPLMLYARSPAVQMIEKSVIGKNKRRVKLGLVRTLVLTALIVDWLGRCLTQYVIQIVCMPL